ncbi:MAG: hypothetical protein IPI95_12555 [Flavobacteriales bacterium]|nr:hypothetical protein [Flavobacteriales bacterium]
MFKARNRPLACVDQPEILSAIEFEIANDEAIEVCALFETDNVRRIPQLSVELGSDPIEILWPCILAFLILVAYWLRNQVLKKSDSTSFPASIQDTNATSHFVFAAVLCSRQYSQ